MKLVTCRTAGSSADHAGILADDVIVCLTCDDRALFRSMVEFLEAGEAGLAIACNALAAPTSTHALEEVELQAPVSGARKLLALAGNYLKHVEESRNVSRATTETPRVFMKPPSTTLIGPGAPIVLGRYAHGVDWEAELAVVIGRKASGVRREEAMGYVAGYACLNDVSEREFRVFPREETGEWDRFFDWLNGKWGDSYAPMGPYLVTSDEVGDPSALEVSLTLNGVQKQSSSTGRMIFDIGTIIEFISAFCTLEPGDIIATGTPEGVGHPRGEHLAAGDRVEVSITGLGVLSNPVVA